MANENPTPDGDNIIPKWLKVVAFAIPILALIVGGIWTAYTYVRESNAKQAKELREFTIQQSKENIEQQRERTEQQKERTNQEKFRLEGELAKSENIKLSISQKEIERLIQKEAYRNIQEATHQRELEFRRNELEINKEIAKYREMTKQDSIKLLANKILYQKEETALKNEKRLSFLKKIAILNNNSSDQDYIDALHSLAILAEDNESLPSSYYFALMDGLINRADNTTSKAELDLILEFFSTQLTEPYIDRERLNKLLDVSRHSTAIINEETTYTIVESLNQASSSSKEFHYKPLAFPGKILSEEIRDDLAMMATDYLIRSKTAFIKDNTFYINKKFNSNNREEGSKSEQKMYFNLYKLEKISHLTLYYLNQNADKNLVENLNFFNIYFPPSTRQDWLSMSKESLCLLDVSYLFISTNILRDLVKEKVNCVNIDMLYNFQKVKLERYDDIRIRLPKRK